MHYSPGSSIFRLPTYLIERIINNASVQDVPGENTPLSPTALKLVALNSLFRSMTRPCLWRNLCLSGKYRKRFALFMTQSPSPKDVLQCVKEVTVQGHSSCLDAPLITLGAIARLRRLNVVSSASSSQLSWSFCSSINVARLATLDLSGSGSPFQSLSETACWQHLIVRSARTLKRLRLSSFRDGLLHSAHNNLTPWVPLRRLKYLHCTAVHEVKAWEATDTSLVKSVIAWTPNLLVLRIDTYFDDDTTLRGALQVINPGLKALRRNKVQLTSEIGQHCPNLVELEVKAIGLIGAHSLDDLPASIRSLILSYLVDPLHMQTLAVNLANPNILPGVRVVHIQGWKVDDPDWPRSAIPDRQWYCGHLERLQQVCEDRNIRLEFAQWRPESIIVQGTMRTPRRIEGNVD